MSNVERAYGFVKAYGFGHMIDLVNSREGRTVFGIPDGYDVVGFSTPKGGLCVLQIVLRKRVYRNPFTISNDAHEYGLGGGGSNGPSWEWDKSGAEQVLVKTETPVPERHNPGYDVCDGKDGDDPCLLAKGHPGECRGY